MWKKAADSRSCRVMASSSDEKCSCINIQHSVYLCKTYEHDTNRTSAPHRHRRRLRVFRRRTHAPACIRPVGPDRGRHRARPGRASPWRRSIRSSPAVSRSPSCRSIPPPLRGWTASSSRSRRAKRCRSSPLLQGKVGCIIDLGGDLRLPTAALYEQYYKKPHTAPQLLGTAVYGLPELNRERIRTREAYRESRVLSDQRDPGSAACAGGRTHQARGDRREFPLRCVRCRTEQLPWK